MQPLQPWQVQSAIAAAAVIVTVALTTLGWRMAMRTAKRLQDRDREHRQRSVALAMLAEVRRIRGELGSRPDESFDLSIYGSKPMIPEISHWVETVMVDAASVNPEIVEQFMNLDRELHNLRGDQNMVSQAYDKVEEAREAVTRIKGSMDKNDESDAEAIAGRLGRYSTTLMALESKQRKAEERVETLEHLRNRMDESARLTLDRLQEILDTTPTVIQKNLIRKLRDRIQGLRERRQLLK